MDKEITSDRLSELHAQGVCMIVTDYKAYWVYERDEDDFVLDPVGGDGFIEPEKSGLFESTLKNSSLLKDSKFQPVYHVFMCFGPGDHAHRSFKSPENALSHVKACMETMEKRGKTPLAPTDWEKCAGLLYGYEPVFLWLDNEGASWASVKRTDPLS